MLPLLCQIPLFPNSLVYLIPFCRLIFFACFFGYPVFHHPIFFAITPNIPIAVGPWDFAKQFCRQHLFVWWLRRSPGSHTGRIIHTPCVQFISAAVTKFPNTGIDLGEHNSPHCIAQLQGLSPADSGWWSSKLDRTTKQKGVSKLGYNSITTGRNRLRKGIKRHSSNPGFCYPGHINRILRDWKIMAMKIILGMEPKLTNQKRAPNPTPRLQLLPGKGMGPWRMDLDGSENGKETKENSSKCASQPMFVGLCRLAKKQMHGKWSSPLLK